MLLLFGSMAYGGSAGYLYPAVFAIATSLPVVIVAWIFAFSAGSIGRFYNRMASVQKWMNIAVGILFIGVGTYYLIQLI